MTKKETIWRYILEQALQKSVRQFTQKNIAIFFGFSLSTVFNALKAPRETGAISVTGRFFRLRDAEKLLLLWAVSRNLNRDIIYQTSVSAEPREIEGSVPADVVFAAFSAYRMAFGDAPADYDVVYIYSENPDNVIKRFPKKKGRPNLIVLKPDLHLKTFGPTTPNSQTFVDLWNLPQWYAKDFLNALKQKMNL